MNTLKHDSGSAVRFFIAAIGLILIGAVLKELQGIFIPFVIAYFLYFLFAPFNNALYDRKVPVFLLILLDIVILLFVVIGAGGILYGSVDAFLQDIGIYVTKLNEIVRSASRSLGIRDSYFRSFSVQKIIARLDYKELAGNVFTSAFGLSGSLFLILFFFIFIVSGHHGIYTAFKKRFQPQQEPSLFEGEDARQISVESTVKQIMQQIQKYIISKIALNLSAAVLVGATLLILGVDFPLIWAILTFFLNFIPSLGSAFSLIFPTLMALLQFNSAGYALLTASLIAAIQTAVFNFLEPHLLGKRLDLNPIVILLSVLIWGYIWGVVGMLLAVPLTAIIKIVLSNSQHKNAKFIVDLLNSGA